MTNNVIVYKAIQVPCAEMSVLWDSIENQYVMPSLQFSEGVFNNDLWDMPLFIFGHFYKFLQRYLREEITKEDREKFAIETLSKENAKDLINLIDTAKSLGWDKLSY